jgi:hypothetical protein
VLRLPSPRDYLRTKQSSSPTSTKASGDRDLGYGGGEGKV